MYPKDKIIVAQNVSLFLGRGQQQKTNVEGIYKALPAPPLLGQLKPSNFMRLSLDAGCSSILRVLLKQWCLWCVRIR